MAYTEHEKALKRAQDKRYRQAHPEKVRECLLRYRAKHAERVRERQHQLYLKHKDRWKEERKVRKAQNPEAYATQQLEYVKRWRERHPEYAQISRLVRKACSTRAEGTFTADDITELLDVQNHKCYYCGCELTEKRHVDHKLPLSRGGSHWPSNLAVTCPRCNLSKGAKTPEEFDVAA